MQRNMERLTPAARVDSTFRKVLTVLGIIAVLAAAAWFFAGGAWLYDGMSYKKAAQAVDAVVVELQELPPSEDGDKKLPPSSYVIYTYTAPSNGETYTLRSEMASYPPVAQVGDTIRVLCHPNTPGRARMDRFDELYLLPLVLIGFGGFTLIVGIIFLASAAHLRRKSRKA